VTPVPHLSLTGTDLSGVGNLDDVGVSLDRLEELDGDLGLGDGLGGVGNDEWDLLDLLDTVTTGEDKGRESRCGKSRGNGVSALTLVDLDVPLPPGLGRSEHPSTSAHVTESGLSGPLGTTTGDTGDTSDGTTGTPRFSRGLMTGVLSDGVCLTPVLVHGLVHLLDNIQPDRSGEDGWEGKRPGSLSGVGEDVDSWSRGHYWYFLRGT